MKKLICLLFLVTGCFWRPIQKVNLGPGVTTDTSFIECAVYVKKTRQLWIMHAEDCLALADKEGIVQ